MGSNQHRHRRRAQLATHRYTVTYDSKSFLRVLTQRWGSIWLKVLPYCVVNTCVMMMLHLLLYHGIDLQIPETAHNFMSLVLGFMMVSRVTTSLARYNEAREYLEVMNKSCRQLIHTACCYSNTDKSALAQDWRQEVAYVTLILLRMSMAVIDYPSTGEAILHIPELVGFVQEDLQQNLPPTRWFHDDNVISCRSSRHRTDFEENLRIPIRVSYLLRNSIRSQEGRVKPPIPVIAEGDMYAFVNQFMDGYHGIFKLLTTPVSFPLIQMSVTFLFFYLFTIPFALLSDDTTVITTIAHCAVVFILTYGFMGMEIVAGEMDDPFGDDDTDFNNLALAQSAFEDAYVTIQYVDGIDGADKLRRKMKGSQDCDSAGTELGESSWLMAHDKP